VFYGSRGRVTGNEFMTDDGKAHDLSAAYNGGSNDRQLSRHFPLSLTDPFALNQYDWLDAICERREPETSGREGLRDLAVAFAILESDLAGRRVTVDEVLNGDLREFQRPLDQRYGFV